MIVAICLLFFAGFLFFLQRRIISLVLGVLLVGNAVNLAIFFGSSPGLGRFAFIQDSLQRGDAMNDPIPQALVLTAIVIGFAMMSFMIAIVKSLISDYGIFEVSDMTEEDAD